MLVIAAVVGRGSAGYMTLLLLLLLLLGTPSSPVESPFNNGIAAQIYQGWW